MPYLKPPALTRKVVNPLLSRLHTGGVATLTVAGRVSGRPRSVPVIPVTVADRRYLVAPYGESDWVRNLRAAGKGMLRSRRESESFHATEVPAEERTQILDAYGNVTGKTVERCFATLPDAADHPVFRVESDAAG